MKNSREQPNARFKRGALSITFCIGNVRVSGRRLSWCFTNTKDKGAKIKNKLNLFQRIVVVVLILSPCLVIAETTSDIQTLVKGNNDFGFNLYQKLKDQKGNLFFSPCSISTALAMTYAGARGQTAKEMAEVLHFTLNQESLHSSFSKLQSELNTLQNKEHIKLSIANSLWAEERYHFLPSFLDLNKKYYGASLNFVDFVKQPEAARQKINSWVEDRTQKKITGMISQDTLNAYTVLVLCNAIYFKGDWSNQFDKKMTKYTDFYIAPDKTIKVSMMNKESKFKYDDFNEFSAIELPYEGKDLSMVIFLPKKVDGLANLEKVLTNDNVSHWIDELSTSYESEIIVSLPKFKTTTEFELKDILTKMGMPDAFAFHKADFSGITGQEDLYISNVIHKAYVDVDEKGTETTAATAVVMHYRSMPNEPLIFRADHPFVLLIRDNKTGSILFLGRITDPRTK